MALLNNTARTASVVCKDDVELLVFYKEEFDAIVRKHIYKQREEVIEFCKNLELLRYVMILAMLVELQRLLEAIAVWKIFNKSSIFSYKTLGWKRNL